MTGRTENLYEGTVLLEFNQAKHAYNPEASEQASPYALGSEANQ